MYWVAAMFGILAGEDFSVAMEYVRGVGFKQLVKSKIKLFVALNGVSSMGYCLGEGTVLDVHGLHPVLLFLLLELVVHNLL